MIYPADELGDYPGRYLYHSSFIQAYCFRKYEAAHTRFLTNPILSLLTIVSDKEGHY